MSEVRIPIAVGVAAPRIPNCKLSKLYRPFSKALLVPLVLPASEPSRPGVLRVWVRIKTASALLPEIPFHQLLVQNSRRLVAGIGRNPLIRRLDISDDVQTDHVHDPERPIWGAEEEHPESIDVGRVGVPLVDDPQRLPLHRPPDAIDDEPLAVASNGRGNEPQRLTKSLGGRHYLRTGGATAHQLDHGPAPDRS